RWISPSRRPAWCRPAARPWLLPEHRRSTASSCRSYPERGTNLFMVGERQCFRTDGLAFLVPLAGHNQRVAGPQQCNRLVDRLAPVADLDRARRGRQDGGPYLGWHFRTRIVVGDNHDIRQSGGDFAHDGSLAAVTISAAAEDDDNAAGGEGPHRSQNVLQRIGLMRVVHIDGCPFGSRPDKIQATRRAFQLFQRCESPARRRPGGNRKGGRNQPIRALEISCQWQVGVVQNSFMLDSGALAVPLVLGPLEREEIAATADGKHMKTRGLCCGDGRLRPGIVSKYDCRSTLGKQRFKQPQLGAMILFHRGM